MEFKNQFDELECLHALKHYLPAQSPLKDFIHHNTLHAFQEKNFHDALRNASEIFGFKTYLQLDEFRLLYAQGKIDDLALEKAIIERNGNSQIDLWKSRLINKQYDNNVLPDIGRLRSIWKNVYHVNMDKITHPILFRILNNYLDLGISMHDFPANPEGFLASLIGLNKNSFIPIFKSDRAKLLLEHSGTDIQYLLKILVGDPELYSNYLFDQQFAHPGWSGMISVLEDNPNTLYDKRKISLKELIKFELLLEIDGLDVKFGEDWEPIGNKINFKPSRFFREHPNTESYEVLAIWQNAYESTYYDDVLAGIKSNFKREPAPSASFHAMFCIDDRECSFRRHIETIDPNADTYGTPGFFNVDFQFKPEHGNFYTKVCPAPMNPNHIILEKDTSNKQESEVHFTKHSHSLFSGWLISQTLGFWSALKLFFNVFKPSISPANTSSFRHMDKQGKLTIENTDPEEKIDGLQVGFTIEEMTEKVEGLLKSIGLTEIGNTIVYAVGHGASSVNNTHYAGYDCGACSGRPGSVNARVISFMGNHPEVRKKLLERGIKIDDSARFIGALHDTTRDEIEFYDISELSDHLKTEHEKNIRTFNAALHDNAKERSRRFILTNTRRPSEQVHEKVKLRSVSLFEPRPELNHATNALCIIGSRDLSRGLFLDRRAFLNSYDHSIDKDGKYLLGILNAAAPVCGGINLEYYFSRTDNYKLGAGSKLPHNVMGLIGVANGTDGDLRTGLPWQMVEVHDPLRLLCIVEHYPDAILNVLSKNPQTENWFLKEWIHLVAIQPETGQLFRYKNGEFHPYEISESKIETVENLMELFEKTDENINVKLIKPDYGITA